MPRMPRPLYKISPLAALSLGSSPSSVIITVLLPLPDSPMSPLKEFSSSAKDTPRTAAFGLFDLLLYVTLRSFISSIIFR